MRGLFEQGYNSGLVKLAPREDVQIGSQSSHLQRHLLRNLRKAIAQGLHCANPICLLSGEPIHT